MFVHFRVLLPAVLATILLASPAFAETPVWSFNQSNDPGHKAVITATLDYGTPQSDAVQLRATCDGAHQSPFVNLLIAADVSGLEDGEEVFIGFRAAGFSQSLKAHVTGANAEEGITGVVLPVNLDEPLWNALTQHTSMSYGIAGLKPGKLALHGGEQPVQNFIAACRALADGEIAAGPPEDTSEDSCDLFGKVRSQKSITPVTVTFINRTESSRVVMWLDFKGSPVEYARLEPRQKTTIKTFLTHPWMFTDLPGNCQEVYLPVAAHKSFLITAVKQNTEPE